MVRALRNRGLEIARGRVGTSHRVGSYGSPDIRVESHGARRRRRELLEVAARVDELLQRGRVLE